MRHQEFEVSVEELLRTLKRRGIPLPSEMGAFITLEVCEQILDRPAHVSTEEIAINEIGEVLCAPRGEVSESESVRLLMLLLGDLLVCSAPGVPGMLLDLVERGPSEASLERLRDELEASLLPLNRGATRRVLARLLREARKAGQTGRPSKQPSPADVDAQFDALLEVPSGRADVAVRLEAAGRESPVTASERSAPLASPGQTGSFFALEPPPTGQTGSFSTLDPGRRQAPLSGRVGAAALSGRRSPSEMLEGYAAERPLAGRPAPAHDPRGSQAGSARGVDLDGLVERADRPSPRTGYLVFAGCLVATLGVLGAYRGLGGDASRSALGLDAPQSQRTAVEAAKPGVARARRAYGELQVNTSPAKAQVLLAIGPGPALATDIPLGVAQEFVALADGYAPARAVLPADSVWESVDNAPRFELAIQAEKLAPGAHAPPLGATRLPRDVGTPQARLGTVRIVTSPKGAQVYQLVGFTPDVRVENLPLDRSYDVLIYLEGHRRAARHLGPAQFEARETKRVAAIEVTLERARDGD